MKKRLFTITQNRLFLFHLNSQFYKKVLLKGSVKNCFKTQNINNIYFERNVLCLRWNMKLDDSLQFYGMIAFLDPSQQKFITQLLQPSQKTVGQLQMASGNYHINQLFTLNFILLFKMVKNTKKSSAGRKTKQALLPLARCALRDKTKSKIAVKAHRDARPQIHLARISQMLNEEILSCSICLQLLLFPVLAQCGHTFCLHCSEDLARNGFACGICHSHLPSYDLQHSRIIENLLEDYLDKQETQDKEKYLKRRQEMQKKQELRRIKDTEQGKIVDYWCEDQLKWKCANIAQKMKNGNLVLNPIKTTKQIPIHIDSRRLAPHRTFTKEQPPSQMAPIQFRAMNLAQSHQFDPLRMRMPERPYIFGGMPFFLGYYWRDENFRPNGDIIEDDNPFTF